MKTRQHILSLATGFVAVLACTTPALAISDGNYIPPTVDCAKLISTSGAPAQSVVTTVDNGGLDPSLEPALNAIANSPAFATFMAEYWHKAKPDLYSDDESLGSWRKYLTLSRFQDEAYLREFGYTRHSDGQANFFGKLADYEKANFVEDFQNRFNLFADPNDASQVEAAASQAAHLKKHFHFSNAELRAALVLAKDISKLSTMQKKTLHQYLLTNAESWYPLWISREKLRQLKIALIPFSDKQVFNSMNSLTGGNTDIDLGIIALRSSSILAGAAGIIATLANPEIPNAVGFAASTTVAVFAIEIFHYMYRSIRGGWGFINTTIDKFKLTRQYGKSLYFTNDKTKLRQRQAYLKLLKKCDAAAPAVIEQIPAACEYKPLPELTFDASDTQLPEVLTEESVLKFGSYLQDAFFKLMKDTQIFMNLQTQTAKKVSEKATTLKTQVKKDKLTVNQLGLALEPIFNLMKQQGENAQQMTQLIADLNRVHTKMSQALMTGQIKLGTVDVQASREAKDNFEKLQRQLSSLNETYQQLERAIILVTAQKAQLEVLAHSAQQFKIKLTGLALISGDTLVKNQPELVQFQDVLKKEDQK